MGSIKGRQITIELALTDDLKQAYNLLKGNSENLEKQIQTANLAIVSVRGGAKAVSSNQASLGKTLNQTEAKAKELGIDLGLIPDYKTASALFSSVEKTLIKANEF